MIQGYHLTMQGMGIRRRPKDINDFLDGAVKLTSLKTISRSVVRENAGFVLIAESHVSIHIQGDRAFADIFSCREFGVAQATGLAIKVFSGIWSSSLRTR